MDGMRLVVAGAGGRMGRMLLRAVAETPGFGLAAAVEREGAATGADAGTLAGLPPLGVAVTSDMAAALDGADGLVDFTSPAATLAFAELAAARGLVHVIGTTGLEAHDLGSLREAARSCTMVRSGNMSLGVNLLAALARRAAAALGEGWDVEIAEMHHRHKVDAPSGTALLLGEAVAEGRGVDLHEVSLRGRDGVTGPREGGTIGFAALRGGSVVGDHVVVLAGDGERIELAHRAEDRMIYARGALRAAFWARGRAPGMYSMADVLGINA